MWKFSSRSQEKENIAYSVDVTYEKKPTTNYIKGNLSILKDSIKYEGGFEKFNTKNNTYYYATKVDKVGKKGDIQTFYEFFSYIKSHKANQGITFIYTMTCADNTKKCNINKAKEEERAKMLMKSVEFKS